METPLERLRHHVTGAIERGEKQAIVGKPELLDEIVIDANGCATVFGTKAHDLWFKFRSYCPQEPKGKNLFFVLWNWDGNWDVKAAQTTRQGAMQYMQGGRVLVDVSARSLEHRAKIVLAVLKDHEARLDEAMGDNRRWHDLRESINAMAHCIDHS